MDKVTSVLSSAVSLCLSATAPGAWCPDAVPGCNNMTWPIIHQIMDTFYGPTHGAKNKMTLRLNFAEVSTAALHGEQ